MPHIKFTSIESLSHVCRRQNRLDHPDTVIYGAKAKIHGTNAAVRIDGNVTAQGRNRCLSRDDDQFGFAAWVLDNADLWEAYAADVIYDYLGESADLPVVVHGEWAGKGVQKGDAVSKLDEKFFFVFAVQVGDDMIVDPDDIELLIPDLYRVVVLPWHSIMEPVDFGDAHALSAFADEVNTLVESFETIDPFIQEMFEVEGPGEGLVFVPRFDVDRATYSALVFKAKTKHHRLKTPKAASVAVPLPEDALALVESVSTDARFEQGLQEACGGVAEPEMTGAIIKWVLQDVRKEQYVELESLEAAGVPWKKVSGILAKKTRQWFMDRCAQV